MTEVRRAALKLVDAKVTSKDCRNAIPTEKPLDCDCGLHDATLLGTTLPILRGFFTSARASHWDYGLHHSTSTLELAHLTCVEATSNAIAPWSQARSHGELGRWHGRLHELLALHCQLFSMKTGSLPVVIPELFRRKERESKAIV